MNNQTNPPVAEATLGGVTDEDASLDTVPEIVRWSGWSLICGGILTFLVNAVFDPLLPRTLPPAQAAASAIVMWRALCAAICVAMLLFGSVGTFIHLGRRVTWLRVPSFGAAFLGSALLLGVEWTQAFDVRDFARRAPDAFNALNNTRGVTLSDFGGMVVLAVFSIGWIGLAAANARAYASSRPAFWFIVAGFFATPLLQPILHAAGAAIAGNALLGTGFAWLGILVSRGNRSVRQDPARLF